ncbi:MAG: hypothetical protein US36_C0006G0023 [Candidatus Wolfebacteria bacterium GW2011_GWC1_37_10]|uniref:Uncharacterized protein n=1 Tax=Candidatus Wolfebacteria bacterium GW2011_GWC1_37_10 TaxID=1619010 RepID=A0A0G0FVG4_9BACT|nr:MAG: hypothetical protein US36_C0006G0023 [Candidatus Wolfebacteria bacterium GW2011_GWC1_37_10]
MGNNKREKIDFGNLDEALQKKGVVLSAGENELKNLGAAASKKEKKEKEKKVERKESKITKDKLSSAYDIAKKRANGLSKTTEEIAEEMVRASMRENVFDKEDKKQPSAREKTWLNFVLGETERLENKYFFYKEKLKKEEDENRRADYEKEMQFYKDELKKTGEVLDKIRKEKEIGREKLTKTEIKQIKEQKEKKKEGEEKFRVPDYIRQEMDGLGKKMMIAQKDLKKAQETGNKKEEKFYKEKAEFLKREFEKAKGKREKARKEFEKKEKTGEREIRLQLEADIAEDAPKISSVPEDAKETYMRAREVEARQKFSEKAREIKEEELPEAEIVEELGPHLELPAGTMLGPEEEVKFAQEAAKIEEEIKEMPVEKKKEIKIGFRNLGFFVKEKISNLIGNDICGNIEKSVGGSKSPGLKGSIGRFFAAMGDSYQKDASIARNHLEESEKNKGFAKGSIKEIQNIGYFTGEILKYGRTVADVLGWTAGSPLRYAMLGAQFFTRGAGAAKEARLRNEELIDKTRIHDIEEAAQEAWKIYETSKSKYYIETGKHNGPVPKEFLEKAYIENLPKDILERLKNSESGTATSILARIGQKILKKDVEFAIKHGKFNEASFAERLKELDRLVSQQGVVDGLAMAAKYLETSGKAVVAGVQIETVALLFQRLPEIMNKISQFSISQTPEVNEILEQKQRMDLHQKALKIVEARQMQQAMAEAAKAGASQVIGSAAMEKMATIGQGEGIWHAVYRQLESNPSKFGVKINPEDLNNPVKLKEILNQKTGQLLAEQGYIKSGGVETRISEAGTKVLLNESGKIKIEGPTYQYRAPIETEKAFEKFADYNLAEQERTLNLYESDIEDFQSKFSAAKVKGDENLANVLEKEIYRLQESKVNLIKDPSFAANREKFGNFISLLSKETGLPYREYSEIRDMRTGRFLEKYLGKLSLWGVKKHFSNLARIIDSYKLSESDKQFYTIDQILKSKSTVK